MGFSYSLVLSIHIIVGFAVIGLVLLQHGKGADMGAAFGSGASGSLFGASGSANFMSRLTAGLAAVFFVTSLSLAYIAMHKTTASGSVTRHEVRRAGCAKQTARRTTAKCSAHISAFAMLQQHQPDDGEADDDVNAKYQ